MKKYFIFGVALTLIAPLSFSASISGRSVIKAIYTYGADTSYQNEVVIQLKYPIQNCASGFWMSDVDSLENKKMISILLSAFHTESTVYLAGDDSKRWAGSGGEYCKLSTVGIER